MTRSFSFLFFLFLFMDFILFSCILIFVMTLDLHKGKYLNDIDLGAIGLWFKAYY